MITIRKSQDRGSFDHGWLKTFHTFSFAQYYDPDFTGYSVLRVINEDKIRGGAGFPMHSHKDMEIITYVVEGALEHKDSMGHSAVIRPSEVQRMTAGAGVRHSEFNHLKDKDTHLLQIWLVPNENSLEPGYEQKNFSRANESLFLIASLDGREGSVTIHQDANVYVGRCSDRTVAHKFLLPLLASRHGWLQIIAGEIKVMGDDGNMTVAHSGDGIAIEQESKVIAECSRGSHFLFFDLP